MEALKQLPIGVQDFEKLRNNNYLYIDKSAFVYQLATTGCYYFLSRPRRFGKSMLISTLHAYFEGKKELFNGLAIAELEKDWTKYPVLHLDLNIGEYKTEADLRDKLSYHLSNWEDTYGADKNEKSLGDRFAGVIRRAAEKTGQQTVILVDEYDKPIQRVIEDEKLQDEFRTVLNGFYWALKTMDRFIRFALITGVTKFAEVSVFSDLNNMEDISMDRKYDSICGITDKELDTVLKPYVQSIAKNEDLPFEEARKEMKSRYGGYQFSKNSTAIYNPSSVLSTFSRKRFSNFWFETGTPTFLVKLLRKRNYKLSGVNGIQANESTLNSTDSTSADPIPIIYQSGYLTIKNYDNKTGLYTLGFPNKEVEDSFTNILLPYYTSSNE